MHEIWVMGSQGDNPQKVFAIAESDQLSRGAVHWSPDGQRLAYLRIHRSSDTLQYSIETCDLKGASRTVVVASDLPVNDFCWLPDRRIVYARQDPLNLSDVNLWQVGIDNHAGTPTGPPKRITQWFGSGLLAINASADGKRLSLLKQTYQFQVYLGELAAGGTRMSPPRRLTHNETSDSPTAWTADSKAVLFLSDRNGTNGIYKQGISQETAEPVFTGPQDVEVPARLSPDGAWILFELSPVPRPAPASRLMRVPAGGGVPQLVLEARNFSAFHCARAPATLCVFVETSQDRKQSTITAFDPLKGRGRVLRTIADDIDNWGYSLSPDGSTFAISRPNKTEIHIRMLALSGGSDREISVKGWPNLVGLDWSTDGKGFYCGSQSPQGSTLLYVDLEGNARPLWQHKGWDGDIWGVPSPDGRYLAIFAGVINSNVWLLEGF
jgi:Tol biopolymer transport system component